MWDHSGEEIACLLMPQLGQLIIRISSLTSIAFILDSIATARSIDRMMFFWNWKRSPTMPTRSTPIGIHDSIGLTGSGAPRIR